MVKFNKIATVLFWLNALILLIIGLAFVSASSFFPFHSDVIQKAWSELEPSTQTLYLGMMRTEGAGYLASAVAIALLLAIPFQRGEIWSVWAITAVGITEHIPTLLANLHVARTTPASPPWIFVAICILSLLLGLALVLTNRRASEAAEAGP